MNDLEEGSCGGPIPSLDGVDEQGNSINGLHFMAFMKSIQHQFEHVTNMWQMNPGFPGTQARASTRFMPKEC